jgi:hypothetical protein
LFVLMGIWALFYMLSSCASVLQYSLGKLNLALTITLGCSAFILIAGDNIAEKYGVFGITSALCGVFLVFTIAMMVEGFRTIKKHESPEI